MFKYLTPIVPTIFDTNLWLFDEDKGLTSSSSLQGELSLRQRGCPEVLAVIIVLIFSAIDEIYFVLTYSDLP